jgi:hypothetical protein
VLFTIVLFFLCLASIKTKESIKKSIYNFCSCDACFIFDKDVHDTVPVFAVIRAVWVL